MEIFSHAVAIFIVIISPSSLLSTQIEPKSSYSAHRCCVRFAPRVFARFGRRDSEREVLVVTNSCVLRFRLFHFRFSKLHTFRHQELPTLVYSPRIGCLSVHTVDSTVSSCPFEQYWLPDLAIVPVSNKSFESTFRRHLMKSLLHLMILNPQTQSCPQPIHKHLARSYEDSQTLSYEDIPSTGSIFNSEHFE